MNELRAKACWLIGVFMIAMVCLPVRVQAAEHPWMLWTRGEAAALRKVVETEDWARKAYERMGKDAGGKGNLEMQFRNLFAWSVMGDRQAAEAERTALMSFAGEVPEGKSRYYSPYQHTLRYDALYGILTPEERGKIEGAFRRFIDYHLKNDPFVYSREAFLPNMQWNRVMGTHLMAVAMGDEALIRAMAASNGGWKWYMDEYVADGAFYFEEFGKHYSMITEMILWCRGLERLGLDELGFGYSGKGGATMRSYLESIHRTGYPRVPRDAARPTYHRLTMGDAGDLHAIVAGVDAEGKGGNGRWGAAHMNGGVPRMGAPFWFEFAHAKWPDAGFDYFLAQMRAPDQERYEPSLFFLAAPVDPARTKPPPAKSYVAPERGFAFLRAEETPAYWESGAPVAAIQFATYYMHYTSDCFSMLQFVANNRVLYRRKGVNRGYAGGCPWTDSVRSQTGVVVDGLRARAVGEVPIRSGFDPLVKFAAAYGTPKTPYPPVPSDETSNDHNQQGCYRAMRRSMGNEIYPGVDLERAMFLTREYLFDVYRLTSRDPRQYHWQVQAVGSPVLEPADAWSASDDLKKDFYSFPGDTGMVARVAKESERYFLKNVRRRNVGGDGFCIAFRQGADVPQGQGAGVRVHVLGGAPTSVYCGNIAEPDHTTLIAARRVPETVFVAVHEPFENDAKRIASVSSVQKTAEGVAVAVRGNGINDRLAYRYFKNFNEPLTLSGNGERLVFRDRIFIRIRADCVEACGDLIEAEVKVEGRPKFTLNGVEKTAKTSEGSLHFGAVLP
jgi:hypothetical protein